MINTALVAYCNTLRFENGSEQVYIYGQMRKVEAYLERLTALANDVQFAQAVERGLASSHVRLVAMCIGQCQDSLYDLHGNRDADLLRILGAVTFRSVIEKDAAAHLAHTLQVHFDSIPLPTVYSDDAFSAVEKDRSFYDDFLELVQLMLNHLWPASDVVNTDVHQACGLIHDAWAIKTFFKHTQGAGYAFNADGFKKDGTWLASRVDQCMEYDELPPKEQCKDLLSWAAVVYVASHMSTVAAQAVVMSPQVCDHATAPQEEAASTASMAPPVVTVASHDSGSWWKMC